MQDNGQTFKVTTGGKPPTPKKWFILLTVNVVLGGLLFFYAAGSAWSPPAWERAIRADIIIEILGFILGTSAVVFALAFIVDFLRLFFGKSNKEL